MESGHLLIFGKNAEQERAHRRIEGLIREAKAGYVHLVEFEPSSKGPCSPLGLSQGGEPHQALPATVSRSLCLRSSRCATSLPPTRRLSRFELASCRCTAASRKR